MVLNSIPKKPKEMEFKYLDDETFILSIKNSRFYKLDKVGTDAWKLVNGKRTVREIANKLFEKYNVAKSKVQKDIVAFVKKGVKRDILHLTQRKRKMRKS